MITSGLAHLPFRLVIWTPCSTSLPSAAGRSTFSRTTTKSYGASVSPSSNPVVISNSSVSLSGEYIFHARVFLCMLEVDVITCCGHHKSLEEQSSSCHHGPYQVFSEVIIAEEALFYFLLLTFFMLVHELLLPWSPCPEFILFLLGDGLFQDVPGYHASIIVLNVEHRPMPL